MSNGFSFPSELIYIIILIVLSAIITILAAKNKALKNENEYLLSRRNRKKADSEQQTPAPCPNGCGIFCNYRSIVIPSLEAEVAYWQEEYRYAEIRCSIAQSTICKLRTAKEGKDVQGN